MSDPTILTDHQAIRDWAAARAGKPAFRAVRTGTGETDYKPIFMFGQNPTHEDVFGQHSVQDANGVNATSTQELVEWRDWLAAFDEQGLALQIPSEQPGVVSEDHSFVARG